MLPSYRLHQVPSIARLFRSVSLPVVPLLGAVALPVSLLPTAVALPVPLTIVVNLLVFVLSQNVSVTSLSS